VLDVGLVTGAEGSADDADLAVFVDRLAAAGGSDRATARAREQVLRTIREGYMPPGLRRLAEALAASVGELPPRQRRPADDAGSVVAAMRTTPLVVLEKFDSAGVAAAVAALVADGRRVVVTGDRRPELAAVRDALPDDVAARTLERLPTVPSADLRRLRGLLATVTPTRRARRGQQVPPAEALPAVEKVAELCRQATRSTSEAAGADLIPGLLSTLEPDRLVAVTSVARCVRRSLDALGTREERPWAWSLLSDLVHSRHRSAFDRMLEDTAQGAAAVDRARDTEAVTVTGPLPASAVEVLRRYLQFLESGGRSRQYFRSTAQRDADAVLRVVRVGGESAETAEQVRLVLSHVQLAERLGRIDAGCAEMGVPAPRDARELDELTDGLVKVAAAARSVGALRHDVLFLHPTSPVAVPDLAAAEQIAAVILSYAEHGSASDAARALDRAAGELATLSSVLETAPEHERAVAALRDRDASGYAAAVEALVAARREVRDEQRAVALLDTLRRQHPRLAAAWEQAGGGSSAGLGLACFLPLEALLEELPRPDSADVVVVLGAARLGVERLLLAATAPRLIAAVASGERSGESPTLLSVLQRAAALVIRAPAKRTAGRARVVRLASGPTVRSVAVAGPEPVEQAGA
jgi:hypothetical protein